MKGQVIDLKDQMPDPRELRRFRKHILQWYKSHGRRFPWRKESATQYQMIITEVLLQRTRAETIAAFFPGFIHEFPSWKQLSVASLEKLQHSLQPIGLWRRRAASIHVLAKEMARRNGKFPRNREEIENLSGIGQYITSAVLLFCHGEPQPLLDTNMARVLERVFGPRKMADIRYDPYLQALALKIVRSKHSKKINWAILDLAAAICLINNPLCTTCPLVTMCSWYDGHRGKI